MEPESLDNEPPNTQTPDALVGNEILFVLGAARSGTTFVNGFLFRWFDYGTGPEGKFVIEFHKRAKRYAPLEDPDNRRKLIKSIATCEMLEIIRYRWPEEIRFDVTPEQIDQEIREPTYAGIVHAVFACVAKGQSKLRIGNKYPGYWRHLPLLHSLFPSQSKYLCIVRDGRDVALSTMKTKWGERNAYASAKEWARCIDSMLTFEKQVGPDRLLFVRYEDLLSEPESSISAIADFLEITMNENDYDGAVEDAMQSASVHAIHKWHTQMTTRDRVQFEAAAGTQLAKMGYATEFPVAHISAVTRSWLTATNYAHKVKRTLFGA